ncbi:glycosyltransferase family 39 protein [Spirosoma gilvum]
MSFSILFLIATQFLTGFGAIARLRPVTNGFSLLGLSMLMGLGLSSGVPFMLEFIHLPIARTPMFVGLVTMACISLFGIRQRRDYLQSLFSLSQLRVRLYELPFLAFWGYLLFISAWKCAWFPNLPFDTIVGPDLVATFAVKEHRLVSSVFTSHLPSVSVFSNQPFYAPFTAMQQIIYLLAADGVGPFAFGKLWLTILVIPFGLFLYAELRERIHPLLAGLLITILACSPELFAYTFLVQTDWANAAFFVTGVMVLQRYLESGQRGSFIAGMLFLALACWTRTETILFVPIGSLLIISQTASARKIQAFQDATLLLLTCLIPVLFWNYGFLRGFVPLPPHTHLGVVHSVSAPYVANLLAIYQDMNELVVFHDSYWNYAVPVFIVLALTNLLIFRDKHGLSILIWILGTYFLFGLIILHVEGANISYTFRRGFFKLLLLMYVYLGSSSLFQWLSSWLYLWEGQATKSPVNQ